MEDRERAESQAPVRVMTHRDYAEYEDITIEETVENQQEEQAGPKRPETFGEAYEDNSNRRQQDFRGNFRSYGGASRGTKIYSFNLGRGLSSTTKWKYRIIGAVAAAAIICFLVFVALPVVAVGIVVAMVAYFLYSFFA